jgi:hypothetical protein
MDLTLNSALDHVSDRLGIQLQQLRHIVHRHELIRHGLSLIETTALYVRVSDVAHTLVGP